MAMGQSMIEEVGDQSFESGMMSFQDIKTELDLIHPSQTLHHGQLENEELGNDQDRSRRNILPFSFRRSKPEKANVAVKEYVAPTPSTDTNKATLATTPITVDKDKVNDARELSKQFEKSHFARVRARFVVPCILIRGKNICRSSTLSSEAEVIMHSVINDLNQKRKMLFLYGAGEKSPDKEDRESSLEKQRMEDIELLRQLGVAYINDLMVENRKVKYGLKVTSSEKVDSFGRYSKFKLVATPYPGVEFFQKFKANKYSARKLCFDWSQGFADAELQLPPGQSNNLGVRWKDYKNWDLVELTQNYLRLYLSHIADDTMDQDILTTIKNTTGSLGPFPKGLLIHCISGWDRTPLFISLLRISLWADGEAHQSLTAAEMLYLTMGYDWFLFNHLLADRSQRGEDIFYFCFYFLKFIYDEDFSLKSISKLVKKNKPSQNRTSKQFPSNSPILKDIGRLRGKDDASPGRFDMDDHIQGYVCNDCKLLKKSPNEPIGRDIKSAKNGSNQEAASSTDGKSSSWQFVSSFSTPPGREKHGSSPRTPFAPTIQLSRTTATGSPLGDKRNSYTANFGEESKGSSLDQETSTATSPLKFTEGRFRLGLQQLNARRSSSSGIPSLISEEARRAAQRASGTDYSRMSASPEVLNDRDVGSFEDAGDITGDPLGERQSTPRKRASTFDGGLLSSSVQSIPKDTDGFNHKEQGSINGDDDNGNEDPGNTNGSGHASQTRQRNVQARVCHVCHTTFFSGTDQSDNHETTPTGSSLFTTSGNPIPGHPDTLNRSRQQQTLEHPEDMDRMFSQNGMRDGMDQLNYYRRHSTQSMQDCDREEGMFQLEIEDRPRHSCDEMLSGLDCSESQSCRSGCQKESLCISSCANRDTRNDLPAEDETGNAEGDESYWDETSTMDYGYSPGSILAEFGLNSHKSDRNRYDNDKVDVDGSQRGERRLEDCVQVMDDDDDEDDDCAASLNSRRSSIKMDHHDNDNLFMPSLKGVFSATERPSLGRGKRRDVSSLDNSYLVEDPAHSLNNAAKVASPVGSESSRVSGTNNTRSRKVIPPISKKLTRKQKLEQLRALFMDIHTEIGGGGDADGMHQSTSSTSASRPLDHQRNGAGGSFNSATEEDDDSIGSSSFRAESFSDDPSFHYQTSGAQPTASSPFSDRHGSASRLGSSPLMSRHHEQEFELGFARESPSSRYPDESFSGSLGSRSQQQRQSQGLATPISNGRKSPFEWAFGSSSSYGSSSTEERQKSSSSGDPSNSQRPQYNSPSGSNHYNRPFSFSSHRQQQQQHPESHARHNSSSSAQQRLYSGSGSAATAAAAAAQRGGGGFQDPTTTSTMLGWAGEGWGSSGGSPSGSNASSTGSKHRGGSSNTNHVKENKSNENSGQRGWIGIFV
ncbi:Myotubularin- protein 14 [Mortierella sp. GBA43]|nr:Myotubularin- protein 14 [Mortierella sp. GBA43]